MKKIVFIFIALFLVSCVAKKEIKSALYEVLSENKDDGAKIEFFDIITEPQEFMMIVNDPKLKKKVKPDDIATCNFVIANLGEKPITGYTLEIENVEETDKNIVFTTKQVPPKNAEKQKQDYVNPFYVLKVNSKKEIIFK